MSAFSPTFGFLLFARCLVGFGLGGVPVAYSMFMEFLPSSRRGVWLTVIEVFWTLGSVVEAGLAW
jgi:MFS family permease